MIYPPRTGFAEFRSLDRALRSWGGAVPVSARDFRRSSWNARSSVRSRSSRGHLLSPPTGRNALPST